MSRGRRGLGLLCVWGLAACAGVLGLYDRVPKPFEHRVHVVKGIGCLECHAGVERAGETGPLHMPSTEQCVACHRQPHNPSPCGTCHGADALKQRAAQARHYLRFEHPVHVEASKGNCVRCHHEVGQRDGPLRPSMASCFSCHVHEQQWQRTDCDGCHVDLQLEGTLPESHIIHGPEWLRSHGVQAAAATELCAACHTERSCSACHGVNVPALPTRLRFDMPEQADMHRAGFSARHSLEARADPALCVTCHTESSCRSCHLREGVSAGAATRSPHPPGWVGFPGGQSPHGRAARLDPASCASCHGGAGEQLCVECHRVGGSGGNPHPRGFDSRKSLSEMPCRLCHGGVP